MSKACKNTLQLTGFFNIMTWSKLFMYYCNTYKSQICQNLAFSSENKFWKDFHCKPKTYSFP